MFQCRSQCVMCCQVKEKGGEEKIKMNSEKWVTKSHLLEADRGSFPCSSGKALYSEVLKRKPKVCKSVTTEVRSSDFQLPKVEVQNTSTDVPMPQPVCNVLLSKGKRGRSKNRDELSEKWVTKSHSLEADHSSCPRPSGPCQTKSIKPDGNCFFRSLIRRAVVKHLKMNASIFERYVRKRVREYSKKKYLQNLDFQERVHEYSKKKYLQNLDFKERVREYSKKKYVQNLVFKARVREYLKTKYHKDVNFHFISYKGSICDSGYPLRRWLLTPFSNPQSAEEVRFNDTHAHARSVVERAIGLLKCRWRCLDASGGRLLYQPKKVCQIIMVCAILHNIALMNGILVPPDLPQHQHEEPDPHPPPQQEGHHQGARLHSYLDKLIPEFITRSLFLSKGSVHNCLSIPNIPVSLHFFIAITLSTMAISSTSEKIQGASSTSEKIQGALIVLSASLKMAEARISQDEFMCSVCLDLLKDPVAIPCGHSYCKICITDCWDQEDEKRVYSCPQCRQTFSPRPALAKNTILAEMVEKLKKTKLAADCYAGAGDVQCDVCTGRKHKAVKSCLVCLNSYCQNHLEQHESWFKGKRHNLTDATGRLQEMICQKHDKILEVFCRTDQKCICVLCVMDEHKNHDTVSTAAQRTEKQHQLKETQRSFQQRIQQREKDLQQLREAVASHKRSAQTAVEDSERIFTELIRSIERSRSEATQRIRDQEKTAVSRAEGRLERLEQEINDLRRRDAELEQLSHTQDHIYFLQSFQSLSAPPESTDVNDNPFSSLSSFDGVRESVRQLRDKLEDFCQEELKKISDRVTFTNIVPRTRNDFLQYSHQFTLDLNTVNKHLRLSERNRVITFTGRVQSYPDHPDRFDDVFQVLCRESVCGCCYWEIEWSGEYVYISVSYKSIRRKGSGNESVFGYSDQSWSLDCSSSSYSFTHNKIETELPVKPINRRIGVYVDHSAGTLSFYSVSDTMSLIHTVQTTFTQTLYPGFYVYLGSSVKLCCVLLSLSSCSKMAEARISQDEFMCSVCLDLLKDPVTIHCGHSYCKICITDFWDQEDEKRVYSCPQCRQTFRPRPALAKNTILAEMVEKLKKTKLAADCYAGAGDVQCDVCTGRKHKAVKSCLLCLNSYCQNHLEQHESWFKGKRHNLTDATGRLQEMICQKHDKLLEVFCRTDQKCICVLCMDEHKNHNTVSAAAQRTEKQLKETQRSFQQRIQQREKDLQQLREAVASHKTAVEDSERIFTELIRSIERSRSEATQRIRDQEKTAVSRAEGRLERLEQEINDLRRRDAELEQLSHTQDHIHFLQSFQSLSAPPESTDVNDNPFSSLSSFDVVRESVRQLRDKLEDFCQEELKKISDRVTFTNIVPRTRNDFLKDFHQLTLDLNTVNKRLSLSERNRVITNTYTDQPYPDHPDRFDRYRQVLCRESVCGCCYWEIEWSGSVEISVSYKSISRKGRSNESVFGSNDQSWSLFCSSSRYSFRYNRIQTELPVKSINRRIGVYVDYSAGTLSFYSVSDTMSLIHTVQTTFTQPLYSGNRDCRRGSSSDHHFFLCLKGGFKGKESVKVGKPSTRRQTFTEEQEKLISELTPDMAEKFRKAFTNMTAKSHCTGRSLPGVMDSSIRELPVILMLLEVTTNAGQKIGTLIDLASDTNYITHIAARRLQSEKITLVVHAVGGMAMKVKTKRYLLKPSHREGRLAPQRVKVVGDLVLWESPLGKTVGGAHPDLCEVVDMALHNSETHFARSMRITAVKYQEIAEMQESRAETKTTVIGREFLDWWKWDSIGAACEPMCGGCRCGNCQPGGKDMTLSEERELEMIRQGLRYVKSDVHSREPHWDTKYPWIEDPSSLPNNRNAVEVTFLRTEKQLKKEPEWRAAYTTQV
ncbi:unnamed protein product [Leuciscus chuanchicus]